MFRKENLIMLLKHNTTLFPFTSLCE